jgi:hypothetical protein
VLLQARALQVQLLSDQGAFRRAVLAAAPRRASPFGARAPTRRAVLSPQGTVEGKITDSQRSLFRETLCQTYCTLDEWMPKTMPEIRVIENEVAAKSEVVIQRLRARGEAPPLTTDGYWQAHPARVVLDGPSDCNAGGIHRQTDLDDLVNISHQSVGHAASQAAHA